MIQNPGSNFSLFQYLVLRAFVTEKDPFQRQQAQWKRHCLTEIFNPIYQFPKLCFIEIWLVSIYFLNVNVSFLHIYLKMLHIYFVNK